MKGNLKENVIHIIKVVTGQDYRELKGEWEQQNITIDELTLERNKKAKEVEKLKREVDELQENNEELEGIIKTIKKENSEDKEEYKKEILHFRTLNDDLSTQLELEKLKNKKLEKKLEEKEEQRKQLACRIGGYVTENNKLKDQVDFLKTCKRAPSLEELKNYTLRRKSICKKK